MKFIKTEQDKINPPKRVIKKVKRRPEGMQDDSVSEITDLEQEEILVKYYGDRMTDKDKKAQERRETRQRLGVEGDKHICKGPAFNRDLDDEVDVVDMEIRTKDFGKEMIDDELSAHQFSLREVSI